MENLINPFFYLLVFNVIAIIHTLVTKKDVRVVALYYSIFLFVISLFCWVHFDSDLCGYQFNLVGGSILGISYHLAFGWYFYLVCYSYILFDSFLFFDFLGVYNLQNKGVLCFVFFNRIFVISCFFCLGFVVILCFFREHIDTDVCCNRYLGIQRAKS